MRMCDQIKLIKLTSKIRPIQNFEFSNQTIFLICEKVLANKNR